MPNHRCIYGSRYHYEDHANGNEHCERFQKNFPTKLGEFHPLTMILVIPRHIQNIAGGSRTNLFVALKILHRRQRAAMMVRCDGLDKTMGDLWSLLTAYAASYKVVSDFL
jgi:hypothetical protein